MRRHLFRWPIPLPFAQPLIVWASIAQPLWWFLFGSLCEVRTSFASALGVLGFRWRMSSTRGAVTSVQALNWLLAILVGICTPRPPCHAGRANKSLSRSVIPCQPLCQLWRVVCSSLEFSWHITCLEPLTKLSNAVFVLI